MGRPHPWPAHNLNMQRQAVLLGSLLLNAVLLITLCSSMFFGTRLGAATMRPAAVRVAPISRMMPVRRMATYAQQNSKIEDMKRNFAAKVGPATLAGIAAMQ